MLLALGGMLLCLQLSAQSVSLSLDNVTVKEAITQLKEKYGYSFMYAANDIDTHKIVSVHATELKDVVNQILKGQDLSWEIHKKSIVISKKVAPGSGSPF